ncbi:MAG: hypothetical protein GXP40_13460 [Chloroflexi bacterium]|nr:hypothetical protein [Chloroflexota bacterium]
MKRFLPYAFLIAGLLTLTGALLLWQHTELPVGLSAEDVPKRMAGVPLAQVVTGNEAIVSINQLHGKDFPLADGAVAVYGSQQAVLWVSVSGSARDAEALLAQMTDGIAAGRSPFTSTGVHDADGRAVYGLTGLGQRHFYFQSGRLVVWLSADEEIAEQALEEALKFYP